MYNYQDNDSSLHWDCVIAVFANLLCHQTNEIYCHKGGHWRLHFIQTRSAVTQIINNAFLKSMRSSIDIEMTLIDFTILCWSSLDVILASGTRKEDIHCECDNLRQWKNYDNL